MFFVDENMLPIGKALALVRSDVIYPGHPDIPSVPTGTKDLDLLPIIGAAGHILITRDNNIRQKPAELAAYKAANMRGFFLTGKKDLNSWGKLDLLVRSWDRIERAVAKNGAGPWAMGVIEGRVNDIPL